MQVLTITYDMRRRRGGVRSLNNALLGFAIFVSFQDWIPHQHMIVYAGKSATRSSLVASTQLGGGKKDSVASNNADEYSGSHHTWMDNTTESTPVERLRGYLLNDYDKLLPPVRDYGTSVKIQIDMTYRQVLDLDEKNQILKSLIWYRQYWKDENLMWDPKDFAGISEMTIPASGVWRPDIAVYEEVGARDLSPRLPFIKVSWAGEILFAEPTILETSCGVNTAFFPFDSQLCTLTFVSWTQPLTYIDLRSRRDSQELNKDSTYYFIDSGEWILERFSVRKQINRYDILPTDNETKYDGAKTTEVPATEATEARDIAGDASDFMYSELRFSLVIRRSSGLYMQSMLFPSILLTSVALLGFYLPPDSGERVGLQITILLTFMVFLLTVGEMFPASTGPYIGVYFVLSMGQLGVNILMTIIVLHIHFKPCLRNISSWKAERSAGGGNQPDSMIPVNLRRVLQFCNRYVSVADPGASWMLPITKTKLPELTKVQAFKLQVQKERKDEEQMLTTEFSQNHLDKELSEDNRREGDIENGKSSSPEGKISMIDEETGCGVHMLIPKTRKRKSPNGRENDASSRIDDPFKRTKSPNLVASPRGEKRKINSGRGAELQKMIDNFRLDINGMVKNGVDKNFHGKDTEEEMEESREKEQEEWKSVARAVDKLFFRFYILLMLISYAALAGVAIRAKLKINSDLR